MSQKIGYPKVLLVINSTLNIALSFVTEQSSLRLHTDGLNG